MMGEDDLVEGWERRRVIIGNGTRGETEHTF
jgi:hypothetical protein